MSTVETATGLHPITPASSWDDDDPSHPGFVLHGIDDTPGPKAYYIHLEARPGKEDLVRDFQRDILRGVRQEPGTGPWFGLRYSRTTFAVFEAFADVSGRNAHNVGPGGLNFTRKERLREMLAYPAQIYRLDVQFGKFGVILGKEVRDIESNEVVVADDPGTMVGGPQAAKI